MQFFFHNSNVFGSCIIHILYTGCAKIKKNNSGAKRLIQVASRKDEIGDWGSRGQWGSHVTDTMQYFSYANQFDTSSSLTWTSIIFREYRKRLLKKLFWGNLKYF